MATIKDITSTIKTNYSLNSHTHSHIKNDLKIGNESGSSAVEGGEIVLTAPPQISTKVNLSLDNYNNHFRVFKNGGGGHVFDLDVLNETFKFGGKNVACIESYRSGNMWYRKYADGFLEQGNYWSLPGSNVTWDWTFPVPFIDQQYAFSIAQEVGSTSDSYNENVFCQYRSNTLFRLYNSATSYGSGGISVVCSGYWK